jgi:hypothetical protein
MPEFQFYFIGRVSRLGRRPGCRRRSGREVVLLAQVYRAWMAVSDVVIVRQQFMAEIAILTLFHGQNKQKRLDDNTTYHLRGVM